MSAYFRIENMSVGYNRRILIRGIDAEIEKGSILTLIGPNGAGKSTILKSMSDQISKIAGTVWIDGEDTRDWTQKKLSQNLAVMLTDRVSAPQLTCADIAAMGRYPYTNFAGRLTAHDRELVQKALERVDALDLANEEFQTLSDGQKQRILLARAICQEPEVLVLDEPTAYLDIRHKIELLDILREMAAEKGITVIMSLHEIDLATKISDYLLCVKGEAVQAFGTPSQILRDNIIEKLYGIKDGAYNPHFGCVELKKTSGEPEVFIIGGAGAGIPIYRHMQKRGIPFATGILFENDIDFQAARNLSDYVVSAKAFEPMCEHHFQAAAALISKCGRLIDSGAPSGALNELNKKLIDYARGKNIPICTEY